MKTIAVIFGGRSTEHDVSIVTAIASIIKPLKMTKNYKIMPVYITKSGEWYADTELGDISLYSSGAIEQWLARHKPLSIQLSGGLGFLAPSRLGAKAIKVDLVFPAMHGTHGEDGELMGVLEMAGVPYVGCGPAASAIAMDKVLAKQVTEANGVKSTPWIWCSQDEIAQDIDAVMDRCKDLQFPIFVKPAHLGSSIGITRAVNEIELQNGLELAAHYDTKIIIEQGVKNLVEVTLPIIGNSQLCPALLEQPLNNEEGFFGFDTKYMHGGKKGGAKNSAKMGKGAVGAQGYSQLPADLPKNVYDRAVEVGCAAYRAVGCEGIARIDMLIDSKRQEVYFNEINPLPGSLYAHNWRQAGLSGVELVEELVRLASESYDRKKATDTIFETNFLKQF
ncbi:MAG: D-alanine--D-alanine ligase [Patescibacteria group bacterium]|nr:D-alanine--D-alanine ligase [Candidatus Saccharibacteria bacterium]MDQ5962973.1 D-alanine--D-alanine ligase [Patescibacteria group bacterium]